MSTINIYEFDINIRYPVKNLIITVVSSSIAGSSIFYVRKLYKSLINDTYNFGKEVRWPQRSGTFAFYFFRPIFSAVFSLVVFSAWIVSLNISQSNDLELSWYSNFVVYPMGFFSGFAAGKLLNWFEDRGISPLNPVAKK